ncbi:MAG: hypothetical protein R3F46_15305 [bacterium]|nr:hypothetical protein [bacterium]
MYTSEIRAQRQEEINYGEQFMACWDFEVILAELRRNPVLEVIGSNEKVFAIEYFASA